MNASESNSPRPNAEPTAGTVTLRHDWDGDEPLAVSIVSAVARLADCEPEELPRLYDRIDPDSLEQLFQPCRETDLRNGGHLWFALGSYGVTVYGDGLVIVRRLE